MKLRRQKSRNSNNIFTQLVFIVTEVKIGIAIVIAYTIIAIITPYIAPYDPLETDPLKILNPPNLQHLLGTDEMGRDLLTLNLYAIRPSLVVGLSAAIMATILGLFIGILSGYFRGFLDEILMKLADFLIALPQIVLMVVIAAIISSSIYSTIVIIAILTWPPIARVIRSAVLYIKELPFIEAIKALGSGDKRILFKHIIPQLLPLAIANTVLSTPNAILSYTALVFLGAGDLSEISWGTILHNAYVSGALAAGKWWYFLPPGVFLSLLVVALMLMGYGLEKILNPRLREELIP